VALNSTSLLELPIAFMLCSLFCLHMAIWQCRPRFGCLCSGLNYLVCLNLAPCFTHKFQMTLHIEGPKLRKKTSSWIQVNMVCKCDIFMCGDTHIAAQLPLLFSLPPFITALLPLVSDPRT